MRWTGRPGYPVRSMVAMMLAKAIYSLPTWTRVIRLVAEHPALQSVVGCVPSQWACYRFARQLRDRDSYWLQQCVNDVIAGLRKQHPTMGENIAIDASDLPAYSNGRKTRYHAPDAVIEPSDKDASWGYRSAVSTRSAGTFFGFKIDAAVDVATGLPVAWNVRTAKHPEQNFAIPLVNRAKAPGFDVKTAIMDKGYDVTMVHNWCMERDVAPVIAMRETNRVKRGATEPPHSRRVDVRRSRLQAQGDQVALPDR